MRVNAIAQSTMEAEVLIEEAVEDKEQSYIFSMAVCRCAINRTHIKVAILLLIPSLRPWGWIAYLNTSLQAKHGLSY